MSPYRCYPCPRSIHLGERGAGGVRAGGAMNPAFSPYIEDRGDPVMPETINARTILGAGCPSRQNAGKLRSELGAAIIFTPSTPAPGKTLPPPAPDCPPARRRLLRGASRRGGIGDRGRAGSAGR